MKMVVQRERVRNVCVSMEGSGQVFVMNVNILVYKHSLYQNKG